MSETEVVCATPGRKEFEWQLLGAGDAPINVAGGVARWQGESDELPPVGVAGCSTNGTTTVSRAAGDFASDGVRVGMKISGTNIPAGALVTAVATTTVTISAAATGTGSSLAMIFSHYIDAPMAIRDAPNGVFVCSGINALVLASQLGPKSSAAYRMRPKFTDASGNTDFGDEETWTWLAPPI